MLRLLGGTGLLALVALLTVLGWGLGPAVHGGWQPAELVHLGGAPEVAEPQRLRVVVLTDTGDNAQEALLRAMLWRPDLLLAIEGPADGSRNADGRPLSEHVALQGELTWRAFLPRINRRALPTRDEQGWRLQRHVRGLHVYSNRTLVYQASAVDAQPTTRTTAELLREPAPAWVTLQLAHPDQVWSVHLAMDHDTLDSTGADLVLSTRGTTTDVQINEATVDILQSRAPLTFADERPMPALFLELERR